MTTLLDMCHCGAILEGGRKCRHSAKATKEDLVRAASKMCWATYAQCQSAVEALLAVLVGRLAMGHTVQIRGFGTLRPHRTKARRGRNVRTGASVAIPAQKTVKVKFPKGYLDARS